MTRTFSISADGQRGYVSRVRLLAVVAAAILLAGGANRLSAQWTDGPSGPVYYNGGNVGVGIASPMDALQVNIARGTLASGINVPYSINNLTLSNTNGTAGTYSSLGFAGAGWPFYALAAAKRGNSGGLDYGDLIFKGFDSSWNEHDTLTLTSIGNVGIGTTNPTNKLSVTGTVQAYEVLVNANWSDYVFAPNYHLRPLADVAAYIKQNQRLPDMPSAAEVEKSGVAVGEMESKLLAKIEELTLHMIQAGERNDRLDRQNLELQKRIARLEDRSAGGGDK